MSQDLLGAFGKIGATEGQPPFESCGATVTPRAASTAAAAFIRHSASAIPVRRASKSRIVSLGIRPDS
ncbi:MAG: hypothetical protein WKF47_12040 [Geodermatophilaceae bacterium]